MYVKNYLQDYYGENVEIYLKTIKEDLKIKKYIYE